MNTKEDVSLSYKYPGLSVCLTIDTLFWFIYYFKRTLFSLLPILFVINKFLLVN